MDLNFSFQVYIYGLSSVDCWPFEKMERRRIAEKRFLDPSDYGYPNKQKPILDCLISSCKNKYDEINEDSDCYIGVLPYDNMLCCFNNVHKGSAVIASTFPLKAIIPNRDIEEESIITVYPIAYGEACDYI